VKDEVKVAFSLVLKPAPERLSDFSAPAIHAISARCAARNSNEPAPHGEPVRLLAVQPFEVRGIRQPTRSR